MKVRTAVRFRDLEAGVIREIGEEFEIPSGRGDKLVNLNLVKRQTEKKAEIKADMKG